MARRPSRPSISAAIAVGAALAAPAATWAQQTDPNQTNISTGSGAGTSPGLGGTSSTRIGRDDPNQAPGRGGVGPVVLPTTPSDPAVVESFERRLLPQAREIRDPDNRALALERAARAFISMPEPRFAEAKTALAEASAAAQLLPEGLTRDLRFRQVCLSYILLAEEETRESMTADIRPIDSKDPNYKYRDFKDRTDRLTQAVESWDAAVAAAREIRSGNYRSDIVFRIVDSEAGANGSQSIVNAGLQAGPARRDLDGRGPDLARLGDDLLVRAYDHVRYINIVIWRDRALTSIALSSAASDQFARGAEIARNLPQPEFRADAQIRLAESMARRGNPNATAAYSEAARSVASIPLEDPRAILASVLIDSLIAVGRFDDARACVPFYPDELRRLTALGAIAMSQGERDLGSSAFAWIERDAVPDQREFLRRKVSDGMLAAIEKQINKGQSLFAPAGGNLLNRAIP